MIPDPRTIPQSEMPLLIDCNQKGLDGEIIDWRTDIKGVHPFCHSMLSIDIGSFDSQTPGGYHQIPMGEYMVANTYMLFTTLVNSNPDFVAAFRASVLAKLNGPWYRKIYNWGQILFQALPFSVPWLSWPGVDDCTMDVIYHLKKASPNLPNIDNAIINGIPNNCNPEQFADIKIQNPQVFKTLGVYDTDNGGITI